MSDIAAMVSNEEWTAAVAALPERRDGDNSPYGEGWNDYAWELVSEGVLMKVLLAAERARRSAHMNKTGDVRPPNVRCVQCRALLDRERASES